MSFLTSRLPLKAIQLSRALLRPAALASAPAFRSDPTHLTNFNKHNRHLTTGSTLKMPEQLSKSEVTSKTDPSVAKQWDNETPMSEQVSDLYSLIDSLKLCMFTTTRPNVGPVSRAMALAKRSGPDLLFLANTHSDKFSDLDSKKTVLVTFSDSTSKGWVSITGEATTVDNSDPRIKDIYSPTVSAWFGDLGDGKHDGSYNDPRMALIEVKTTYVSYWKKTTGTLGFLKEVGQAALTGSVAQPGLSRRLEGDVLEQERSKA
ncbi:Protein bli-3 [Cyphellophora attinorum]|uniref:Protein bli-3 n=1 Tax=Cyphellophora attinorum TaxID=1664694 RepID=A0A0N1H7W9_9EURO|nr:Protein bli-3 [Phialophora attinorum]KPI37833.1 Protein bli-3 [Phialophora attinorum]